MEWVNISVTQMAEAEVRRSTHEDRGVWLTLLTYCVQQENDGRVAGAGEWSDFECRSVLGAARAQLDGVHLLWQFEGPDLIVHGYPHAKAREVAAKRRAGRKGNRMRWGERSHSDTHCDSDSDTHCDSDCESGKEEERKGNRNRKGNGTEGSAGAGAPRGRPDALDDVKRYAAEIGLPEAEAGTFFDHFEANGWRQGGRAAIRDWRAALRNWHRRWRRDGGAFLARSGAAQKMPPFNPAAPHAHTGGLEVFSGEEVAP